MPKGKLAAPANLSGPDPTYFDISFSPDGKTLAAVHMRGFIDYWDLETNDFLYRHHDYDGNLIFRKSSRLVVWNEQELLQIQPENGNLVESTRDFDAGRRLNFSPGGRWLFADWVVWDMENLTRAYSFGDGIVAAVSPDGESIFAYQPKNHVFYQRKMDGFGLVEEIELSWDIYDIYSETYLIEWIITPYTFSISPSGEFVSVKVYDYGLQTWNTTKNRIEPKLSDYLVREFIYSPDGKYFAMVDDSYGSGVKIFQLEPEVKNVFNTRSHNLCGFSPDSKRLLIMQGNTWYLRTMEDDGTLLGGLPLQTEFHYSSCPAFSPDNKLLAVNSDGEIKFVDLETGLEIVRINNLDLYSSTILFSPDGRYLATSSWDGTVRIWGIPNN